MNELPNETFVSYENQRYVNCPVPLDNGRFFRCTFRDVALIYSGGPTILDGCTFEGRSRLVVQGAAMYAFDFFEFVRQNAIGLNMPKPGAKPDA